MELKWLEDLVVLLEEKSFTRAAVRRHVTQPAFSRRIRLLEDWLGVVFVDRSTKPVRILPLGLAMEDEIRDLVRRFYGLRNTAQIQSETSQRIIFVAQHTLAMSRFPRLIQSVKEFLPDTAYRVNPANNDDCEALFLKDADFLLCYETDNRRFDFSARSISRIELEKDRLIPVASTRFIDQFDSLDTLFAGNIPLLMYQQGGFIAGVLAKSCLPAVLRNYRIEVICESAFSASLKEMVVADMGIAWLAHGMIENQLNDGTLVSLESRLGADELDVVLYFREDSRSDKAKAIFELVSSIENF
jgi:DNA-binding transcriptional LysR family regulator